MCLVLTWLHFDQETTVRRARYLLTDLREARIDLAKGFLHLTLAGAPQSPFRVDQGLALLQQSILTLQDAEKQITSSGVAQPAIASLSATFRTKAALFQEQVLAFRRGDKTERARLEVSLRLAFHDLDRLAQRMDFDGQGDLNRLAAHLDGRFALVLGMAILLLSVSSVATQLLGRRQLAAMEALRASRERYRELVQNANSAIIRWSKDGTVVFFNEYAQKLFGYQASEIIGQPVGILVPQQQSTGEELATLVEKILHQPEQFSTFVNENITRGGQRIWMAWTNKPILNEQGEVAEILAIGSDITRQKQAEAEKQQWADAFKHCAHGIAMGATHDNTVLACNPALAAMLGRPAAELTGAKILSLYAPADHSRILERITEADRLGKVRYEADMLRSDGTPFPVQMDVVTVRGELGQLLYRIATIQDITDRRRAEEERESLMSRHQLALGAARLGWWHYDPATRISTWDQRYREIFGVSGSESPNEKILARLHPEDLPRVWAAVEAALSPINPKPYSVKYRIRLDDGSLRWIQAHGLAEFAGIGALRRAVRFVGTVEDITEQRNTEEVLRRQTAMIKSLLDSIPDIIFFKDLEGVYLGCNPAFAEYVGRSRDEIIGRTDHKLFGSAVADAFRENDHKMLESLIARHNEEWIDYPDGRRKLIDTLKTPYWGPDGELLGVLGISRDITERKLMEDALREREHQLRLFVEHSPAGVAMLDRDMRYLVVSQRWLSDYRVPERDVVGKSHYEVFPEIPERWKEIHRRCLAGETAHSLGDPFPRSDGSVDWVQWEIRPWRDSHERIGGIIIFSELITARKQAEDALLQRNEELVRFTYTVSHDLKSPLVTIQTFLGFLEKDLQNQDAARIATDMGYVRNAAAKMLRMLEELLELSRVGRKVNEPENVLWSVLVREALDLVAGPIAERGVEVCVAEDAVCLHGDRQRLLEVFQNLIDNAVKFMGPQSQPRLQIGVETRDQEIVFYVRDNGLGIDPRHQSKLFGLFEKLHPDTPGTGIGLALVKRIVEVHGGRIWVESEGANRGATFRFTLSGSRRC